jgi:4-amino-4-deoxy-L-arabinose transferase-like glycosyltransferase
MQSKPWHTEKLSKARALLILVLAGAALRLAVVLGTGAVLWPDSIGYLHAAKYFLSQHSFGPSVIHTGPLYPLFLAVFLGWGESSAGGQALLLAQQLLGLSAAVLFFLAISKHFGVALSFWASLLFGVSPLLLNYERVIQTEILFVFILAVLIWLLSAQWAKRNSSLAVSLGLVCGALSLTRPIAQFLPLVLVPVIWCSAPNWKTAVQRCIFAGVSYVLTLAPWLLANHAALGYWGLSRGQGINLFLRVYELDRIQPLPQAQTQFPGLRAIFLKLRKERPGEHVYFELRKILVQKRHKSMLQADRLLYAFALEGLRQEPFTFLKYFLYDFRRFFLNSRNSVHFCRIQSHWHLCANPKKQLSEAIFGSPQMHHIAIAEQMVYHYFSWVRIPDSVVALLALIGAILAWRLYTRQRPLLLSLNGMLLYFAALSVALNYPEDRYKLPLDFILLFFAVLAVAQMARRLKIKAS